MADARIGPNDTVVLVDPKGRLVRDRAGRVLRGVVMTIAFGGMFDRLAVVSLARSGRQKVVSVAYLRRCPELAYVRPGLQARGAS